MYVYKNDSSNPILISTQKTHEPFCTKLGTAGDLADVTTKTIFVGNRLRGFDSVRSRVLPFSHLQGVAVNTVNAQPVINQTNLEKTSRICGAMLVNSKRVSVGKFSWSRVNFSRREVFSRKMNGDVGGIVCGACPDSHAGLQVSTSSCYHTGQTHSFCPVPSAQLANNNTPHKHRIFKQMSF